MIGLSGSNSGCFGERGTLGVEAVGFGVHLVALPVLLCGRPCDAGVCGKLLESRKCSGLGVDDAEILVGLGPWLGL
jgi:hypothetical protein